MKSFIAMIQKFTLTTLCLFLYVVGYSQLQVEFRGSDLLAPTECASGVIFDIIDQRCTPSPDLELYVKYSCEMRDANSGSNLEFGWYGVSGDNNSWYYIGDPFMRWATTFNNPNTSCGGAPLPIELIMFEAVLSSGKTNLTWTTASEINNDFFTVERTIDGMDFEEVLETPGAGNSYSIITYIAKDENPLPGKSYYRLRQTDFDGTFGYSNTVEVQNDHISNINIHSLSLTLGGEIILRCHLNEEARYDISIYDITGKQVNGVVLHAEVGINEYVLNVEPLDGGVYFLVLQNQYECLSKKLLITR